MHEADTAKKDIERIAEAIRAGDRVALARAITLVESAKPEDQARAEGLLEALLPFTGKSIRVGISGVPGSGKSTLIDQLGLNLTAQGRKVAVLAVDPTSSRTGGSILGDKTRMGRLAAEPNAFIRPSPAGDSLGGVTKTTRETVALADAGDELQGIKRGLLELADVVAVNKAEGDQVERANRAAMEYRTALHILSSSHSNWDPQVLTLSARDNQGLDALWTKIFERHAALSASGALDARRRDQAAAWMREIFEQRLLAAFQGGKRAARHLQELENKVRAGEMTPSAAASELARLAGIKDAD
jgi:LAO/AO transport system kinase